MKSRGGIAMLLRRILIFLYFAERNYLIIYANSVDVEQT